MEPASPVAAQLVRHARAARLRAYVALCGSLWSFARGPDDAVRFGASL
jgi:hypothetical protein